MVLLRNFNLYSYALLFSQATVFFKSYKKILFVLKCVLNYCYILFVDAIIFQGNKKINVYDIFKNILSLQSMKEKSDVKCDTRIIYKG